MIYNNKDHIEYLKAQGSSFIQQNCLEEAKAIFIKICAIDPKDAETWFILSGINGMLGDMEAAGNCCRSVIELQPEHGEAHLNLGNVLFTQGKHEDAVMHYQTALRINPNNAGVLCNLGNALSSLERHVEAEENYQAAIRLNPNLFEPYYNLGNLQLAQKHFDEAENNYLQAIRLNPNFAPAYNNVGNLLNEQGRIQHATKYYQYAIKLSPDFAEAYNNLGINLKVLGSISAADEMTQLALRNKPDYAEAHFNLGNIRTLKGLSESAIDHLTQALEIEPGDAGAHSSLLMSMYYRSEYSPKDHLQAAMEWGMRHSPQQRCLTPPDNNPDPQRILRIGYVSGDFWSHPVGYFIKTVLANHDRSRYEVFCYYNNTKNDVLTRRLQQSTDHWRNISDQSDKNVALQIRQDNIDLLIDLSGHTERNRLLAFAHKPAPIQATWMGYFGTSGLPAMDYIIADPYVIPPEEEHYYVEQVMRLTNNYLCFSPPDNAPEPSPLPALSAGKLTFGCFNHAAKLTEMVIECWAKLLHALPNAQLHLKNKSFGDSGVRQRYQGLFVSKGIGTERIKFSGYSPRNELLTVYHEIDISLDPFPYNGGTTTMEALWMGVPVISLRGNQFVSHVGESILINAGLNGNVVDTEYAYITKAVELASDLPRLAEIRAGLRARLLKSPLCDGPGFTRDLEAAFRRAWEIWCQSQMTSI